MGSKLAGIKLETIISTLEMNGYGGSGVRLMAEKE